MKNSILFLITLSFMGSTIFANIWQDVLGELTNFPKKTTPTPINQRGPLGTKTTGKPDFNLEHAQKLAQRSIIKAMEAANLSASSIKNVALHLNNAQRINNVIEHLSNLINGRGNSLEETEMAKQALHEVLFEARKLEKNAHEATQQLEKTLRITTRLNQRLKSTSSILHPTLARILDTLKTGTIDKSI